MFQAYFEVFHSLLVEGSLWPLNIHNWVPMVTNFVVPSNQLLIGNNMEFDVSDIFWGVLSIVVGGELMTIENPSLSAHGYQLLPIATSQ